MEIKINETQFTVIDDKTNTTIKFEILLYKTITDTRLAVSRRPQPTKEWLGFWIEEDLKNMARGIFGAWLYRRKPSQMSFAWYDSVFAIGNIEELEND